MESGPRKLVPQTNYSGTNVLQYAKNVISQNNKKQEQIISGQILLSKNTTYQNNDAMG